MAGSSEKEFSFVTHKGTRQVCGSAFKSAVKSHPVVIYIGVQKLQKNANSIALLSTVRIFVLW